MVSKRRLDCGFNGYRAPFVPRAPRSIRRRGSHKQLVEDNKLCAFELLAAVAGKLLQESESSASSNIAERKSQLVSFQDGNVKVQSKDDKALKSESFDHGSCAESAFVPEISVQERSILSNPKGISEAENDHVVEQTSAHESSDFLEKIDCNIKLGICEDKNADEDDKCKLGGSVCAGDSFNPKVESGSEVQSEYENNQIGYLTMSNIPTVNDPNGECVKTDVLINPDSSVKLPLYRNSAPGSILGKCWNNVKLGIRDDDENSFRCNKSSTKSRPLRPPPRIGRHRIRNMMASRYRKAATKLKDCELYTTSEGMKSFCRYRKSFYARERCQLVPLKKRKLSGHSFDSTFDQERISGSISNFPEKGIRGDKNSLAMMFHKGPLSGASTKGHPKTKDTRVKFSIKSFKVPELYVEIPETATVGSMKGTVMDAITAILGGGIRVGVVFQGKKVRDDHKTLQQAGISQYSDHGNLGFTLEPSMTHASPAVTPKQFPVSSPCDGDQTLSRSAYSPVIGSDISNASVGPPLFTKSDNVDKNELISSAKTPDDVLMDGAVSDSKALVPASQMNAEALSVVPANSKPKRAEVSQRRTRRPFSVAEVEALVEAIEKLGTGRWRDIKMRAFENADHRTYVDLKDKWKTLVHTASISPQQRRGEPVPHELLNRVLSAHSYWSQHQSKQHGKHTVEPLKILDSDEGIVGV